MEDNQTPGQLIIPHESDDSKPAATDTPEPQQPGVQPQPAPTPPPEPDAPASEPVSETLQQPASFDSQETGWFRPEESDAGATPIPDDDLIWTAEEFPAHDKNVGWYAILAGGAIIVAVLVYLITKDKISTGVVIFAALAFGFFAARKPHTLQYGLSSHGLQIGQKFYGFQEFKTFSISDEGVIISIVLNPLKRFMPPLTVYMSPGVEEQVVTFLSAYLPFEQHRSDMVDNLIKRIRF